MPTGRGGTLGLESSLWWWWWLSVWRRQCLDWKGAGCLAYALGKEGLCYSVFHHTSAACAATYGMLLLAIHSDGSGYLTRAFGRLNSSEFRELNNFRMLSLHTASYNRRQINAFQMGYPAGPRPLYRTGCVCMRVVSTRCPAFDADQCVWPTLFCAQSPTSRFSVCHKRLSARKKP